MAEATMTSRERVRAAFAHVQPDHTPCDYFATPEIHQALLSRFGISSEEALLDIIGTDIRVVSPPYIGPPLPRFDDRSTMNIWGIRKRPLPNEYGDYMEPVNFPYAQWTSVEEAEQFPWPDPDWFDYSAVKALCSRYPHHAIVTGSFSVQDFINGVAFGRGVEQTLIDIATEDPVFLYILERRHRFYMEMISRTLEAAEGRIDMVLCGDDFGTQRGLLISPETFDKLFSERKAEFFSMVHAHGARVTHHCCGSSAALFPRFIAIGMDAVQTIQPRAAGMDPFELKRTYGRDIVLHGAVDAQGWLQAVTPQEVEKEVRRLIEEVGQEGGFILSPSHNFQPDTPIENVLAFYRTVAKARGERPGF
ncbi:uroporphyrinogen decarboxylase family protein [Salinispira pacifica]